MQDKLNLAVTYGEKLGADFVEARYDNLTLRALKKLNDNWKDITAKTRAGIGITCYYQGATGFSSTVITEKQAIKDTVERALKIAKASAPIVKLKAEIEERSAIRSSVSDTYKIEDHCKDHTIEEKTELINRAAEQAKEHGENISNINTNYGEIYGKKMFVNSDQSYIDWEFTIIDLRCSVTSKTPSGAKVTASELANGTAGFDLFRKKGSTPEYIGEQAGLLAKEQIEAKPCPAGNHRTLIENHLAGVLAHETFGHLSESDFVVTGGSPLAEKLGERIGTEHATIIDSGIPDIEKYGGMWLPYDDEGTPTSRTTILKEGILNSYLHSRSTAKILSHKTTGNARAIHFGFKPIVRMTNTYFETGDLSEAEALELLDTGIYAIQTAGGQVQLDGSFLFKANRGYWVENGKIQYPLREVSLSGNILKLLKNVEGATKDFTLSAGYFGGCGKGGQFPLPTGLGGPKLVIDNVAFGGKA